MMAARYFKITWPLIILLSMGLLLVIIPTDTRAQGPVLPTPTNIGGGATTQPGNNNNNGGGSKENSGGAPVVAGAALSGFVYDYSKGGPESGVAVVVTGDGWQAEAISDSNGYYRLGNLGEGSGLVSLRLPPGAHPVVFAWPVRFQPDAEVQVNLGYYWGDKPPLPVLVSGHLSGDTLTVQVENRTAEAATGGVIQIDTPADVKVLPEIEASQAAEMTYDPHQPRLKLASLAAGSTVTVKLGFNTGPTTLRVMFTYDQQRTPQMLEITTDQTGQNLTPASAAAISTPLPPPAVSVKSSQAAAASTAMPVPTPTTAAFTPPPAAAETPVAAAPTPASQLPTTGASPTAGQVGQIALSIIMVVMLTLAGWWSLRAKTLG